MKPWTFKGLVRLMWRGWLQLMSWWHMAFCALMDPEGRRAWAVIIAWGCGVVMTAYATYALWLVRYHAMLAFWLGVGSLVIILVVISAITGLLVKRDIGGTVGKGGINLNFRDHDEDEDQPPKTLPEVAAERVVQGAAAGAAAAAQQVSREVGHDPTAQPGVTPPKV